MTNEKKVSDRNDSRNRRVGITAAVYVYTAFVNGLISLLILSLLILTIPCDTHAVEPGDSSEGVHIPSLIAQSEGMEQRFLYQNLIVDERDLTDYLSEILEKLALPDERRRYRLRVRVLRSNVFNAFAAPNGTVFVCTGLLARMVNETQVAAVLAHELGHVVLDHTEKNLLEMKRQAREFVLEESRRNPESLILSDGVAGTVVGDALGAAIAGYNERIELQADSVAVVRMAAAGYEPPADFRGFINSIKEGYVGAEYGNLDKRKSQASGADMSGGQTVRAVEDDIERGYFNVKLGSVILHEVMMNQAAGRPELAEPLLDRLLAVDSCDVAALIKRGDMERQLSPRSVAAIEWYEKALACSPGNPAALRAIGFTYHSIGRMDLALGYLRGYCETAAGAADIKMARELLRQCEKRGGK
ncbi:MAG: M48 family metalloprotease [Chitinispirillales bacterium]|jgi:predicted Zn-dependent protease|nr:M48 family metalloprotease [Chitinispirillales bacterium]